MPTKRELKAYGKEFYDLCGVADDTLLEIVHLIEAGDTSPNTLIKEIQRLRDALQAKL